MFKEARIQLTAWYLVIIMAISISFSLFIYRGVSLEFKRRFNVIELRLRDQTRGYPKIYEQKSDIFLQDLQDAQKQIALILIYTNGVILIFSGVAGYFLAGKTLIPIEKSMDEQKRFVADASHELKTPLTALHTSIEVALRSKKLNLRNAKKLLAGSLDEIKSLNNLSNDLLSLTKMQSGNNGLSFEKTDIKEIITKSTKKITPIAKKKNIKIKAQAISATVMGNYDSLEKLLTILLDNAVKYSKKNSEISLSLRKKNRNVIIKVKDRGVGIAKKDLLHIFDRFYRADESRTKTKTPGFGLGLSIAKRIVQMHKGSISVKSNKGKGSTFIVKLPAS